MLTMGKVMRYDNGKLAVLRDLGALETYIEQNSSRRIQRKREIRMAFRALEGQIVQWPYTCTTVSFNLSFKQRSRRCWLIERIAKAIEKMHREGLGDWQRKRLETVQALEKELEKELSRCTLTEAELRAEWSAQRQAQMSIRNRKCSNMSLKSPLALVARHLT